jgi:shikimate dehydrogenase
VSGDAKKMSCVIGWPAGHSRSPLIHNYWIKQHGLDAEYRKEAVPPADFPSFVRSLRDRGYSGANVTLPHKEMALTLSKPDERAQAVGAANTLYFENDTLRSTNTDVEGFLANLDASVKHWDRGLDRAVVLGAGGAARGVVHALLSRGVPHIHVVNRTAGRADEIAKRFGPRVRTALWDEMSGLLETCGLLVNTTSLGMRGQPPLDLDLRCPTSAVVAEIVYDPLETPLLKSARAKELRTADGLGMLLHQAVRGFQLWFGIKPEVTADLRALVEADLRK